MLKSLNELHANPIDETDRRQSASSLLSTATSASVSVSSNKRNQRFSLAPAVNFYRASGGRKYDFRKRFSQQYDADAAASSEVVAKSAVNNTTTNNNNNTSEQTIFDGGEELNQEFKEKNKNNRLATSNAAAAISFSDFSSPSLIFWQKMKDKSQSVRRPVL